MQQTCEYLETISLRMRLSLPKVLQNSIKSVSLTFNNELYNGEYEIDLEKCEISEKHGFAKVKFDYDFKLDHFVKNSVLVVQGAIINLEM